MREAGISKFRFSKILKSASTNMLQVATSNSFDMSSGGPKEHLCEFFGGFDHFYFSGSKITPPNAYPLRIDDDMRYL